MNRRKLRTAPLFAMAAIVAGCGGSGSSSGSTVATTDSRGDASISIEWPDSGTRLIPVASNSIVVTFLNGATTVATQTATRPSSGSTSTLTFSSLPAGSLILKAQAFSTTDGTGIALASGQRAATIASGETTPLSLTMSSTISSIVLVSSSSSVVSGATISLTPTAYNSSGAVVLTSASTFTWSSLNPAVATVDSSGVVTGVTAGTASISVTDSESGKIGTLAVTVTAVPGGAIVVVG